MFLLVQNDCTRLLNRPVVAQERLKLSGQRWNKKGVHYLLNLRVVYKSGAWNKVTDLIKNPPKRAA